MWNRYKHAQQQQQPKTANNIALALIYACMNTHTLAVLGTEKRRKDERVKKHATIWGFLLECYSAPKITHVKLDDCVLVSPILNMRRDWGKQKSCATAAAAPVAET